MRIGIDAHMLVKDHKRYDPALAEYIENLITSLIAADKKKKHTWVLFFDSRMADVKRFEQSNVEIKHFPFVHYRRYLPVVYSHMLISAFLRSAKLDVFHSPEGLIPYAYLGNIVTTFHYVPRGQTESNMFVKALMLGARVAFAQLVYRAQKIVVDSVQKKKMLMELHGCSAEQVVVVSMPKKKADWKKHSEAMMHVYAQAIPTPKKKASKK